MSRRRLMVDVMPMQLRHDHSRLYIAEQLDEELLPSINYLTLQTIYQAKSRIQPQRLRHASWFPS